MVQHIDGTSGAERGSSADPTLVLSNDFSDKMHIWNGTELYIQESEHL